MVQNKIYEAEIYQEVVNICNCIENTRGEF